MTARVRIADVALILRGAVPANTTPHGSGPRFFGISEITSNGHTIRFPEAGTDLSKGVYLEEGDVVVALMGRLGQATQIGPEHVGAVLGRECAVVRIQQPKSTVTASWVAACTQTAAFRDYAERNASGTTMPRLPIAALGHFEIPVPPLARQRHVEKLLTRFDEALRASHQTVEVLERLRSIELELELQEATRPIPPTVGASAAESARSLDRAEVQAESEGS
jgi:type I restriction enzyme S subunit